MTAPTIELTDTTRDRIAGNTIARLAGKVGYHHDFSVAVLAAVRQALDEEIAPPQTRTYTVTITNCPELRWLPDAEQARTALRDGLRVGSVAVEVCE
jgi:hypothetical protein